MASQMLELATPLHLRVFLSSPGDVADERGIARRVLKEELPYDPFLRGSVTFDAVSWDDPAAPTPMLANLTPQEAVNRGLPKPSECDIVVVILWSRMGTPLPNEYRKPNGGRYLSGTEWEYEDALAGYARKPDVLVYRRLEKLKIDIDDPELDDKREQYALVDRFFRDFKNSNGSLRGGFGTYATPSEFASKLTEDLKSLLQPKLRQLSIERTQTEPLWQGSPYPGLRAFTAEEAAIFCGRGGEIDKLIKLLHDPGQRFIAVVGASGTGKSSLIRAGLLPRLRENAIPGSKNWCVLDFTPGGLSGNPFQSLAVALSDALPPRTRRTPRELAKELEDAPLRIGELARQVLVGCPGWAELLLFVDQLEELFTIVEESHRRYFVELLVSAAADLRLRVVVALRADFLARAAESLTTLTELLQAGTFPLAPPGPAALVEMIRRPAERAGLKLEEDLVHRSRQ